MKWEVYFKEVVVVSESRVAHAPSPPPHPHTYHMTAVYIYRRIFEKLACLQRG